MYKLNTKQLEKNVEKLQKLENSVDILNRISSGNVEHVNNVIKTLAENEVSPDSEDGKKITGIASIIRNFGQKILNLLVIEIHCSFAGVTLFTWRLPKLKDNQIIVEDNNKKM